MRRPGSWAASPPGSIDPRSRQGRLQNSELPDHRAWLGLPTDLTAESEADLDDIRRLAEAAARRHA
ncbi:hypothetical protein [Streptomyces triticiradicis]|uniref:Uncharacterized protein n=1 Tax=Streptomyces triticiradicis TaxID=2651189 RepID=A0A7J5D938_9ACTN|nr:hypothetical protein [Streptomyces triticiradicis]KAB1984208.1 hypothetical protein F8144_28620 [Streptomyces triticiradicis]